MKIKITRIIDHGQQNERAELAVLENCELGEHIIADTSFTGEHTVSNKLRHMHWFADQKVLMGDKIVLYTRKGTSRSEKINHKNTLYHRYWQLDVSVWNDDGDAAILFHMDEWNISKTK